MLLVGFIASAFALTVNVGTDDLLVHSHAHVQSPEVFQTLTGINLMDGSAWPASLNILAVKPLKLSCRIYWSQIEVTEGVYNPRNLAAYKGLIQACQDRNMSVNLTFWTQFQSGAEDPAWVKAKPGYNVYFKATDPTTKTDWLDFVGDMVDVFKVYTCIDSWSYMNEPFYSTSAQRTGFEDLFDKSYTLIQGKDSRPITCRFGNSYSPASGRFSDTCYNYVDVMGLTVYSYPWQYHLADSRRDDVVFNGQWWMYKDTVADCADLGLPLWLIEFGADSLHAGLPRNFSEEDQRQFYEDVLKIFNDDDVARAYAWAWRSSSPTSQPLNLWTGTRVKDAYYELLKYPLTTPDPPEPPDSPPPAEFWRLNITRSRGGYTNPVPDTYTRLIGESQQVTATPRSNYTFTSWTLDGTEVSTNPIITVAGTAQRIYYLYALFTEDTPTPPDPPTEWTLTMSMNEGGVIDPEEGSHLIDTLSTSATATADEEYSFTRWLWDGGASYADNPITVTAAFGTYHTLEAFFTQDVIPDPPDDPVIPPAVELPTSTPSTMFTQVKRGLEKAKPASFSDVLKALEGGKPRSFNEFIKLLEDTK